MKTNTTTTWRLLIMLNITQIVLASVNIFDTCSYFSLVWGIEWFYKHYYTIMHIWHCNYYCTDAMVKYINAIMCIERWVACKFPFKYKSLCTKHRIYGAVTCCSLWAVIPRFIICYILSGPNPSWRISESLKNETCFGQWKDFKFGVTRKVLVILENFIDIATFAIIPLVLLLVFGILTLKALKQSGPAKVQGPANHQSDALELSLSDKIILKRKERDRMLTKLVLGLVFVNLLFSLTHGFHWLYTIESKYGIKVYIGGVQMNEMLGYNVNACATRAFFLLLSLIFLFNPILYIKYNAAVKNNIKSFCRCFTK